MVNEFSNGLQAKIHHKGIHKSPDRGKPSPRAEVSKHSLEGMTMR